MLEAVKRAAEAELRSVNGQIEILLREALARRDPRPTSGTADPGDADPPPPSNSDAGV